MKRHLAVIVWIIIAEVEKKKKKGWE